MAINETKRYLHGDSLFWAITVRSTARRRHQELSPEYDVPVLEETNLLLPICPNIGDIISLESGEDLEVKTRILTPDDGLIIVEVE